MKDESIYQKASDLINKANKIVFFGGAGVSTESGIKDFRSKDGLSSMRFANNMSYEEILSHECYLYHPDIFFDFYRNYMISFDAKPNFAHEFLAKLENYKDLAIVTQNIDGLHQKAGSKRVYELHGSVLRNYCTYCHKFYDLDSFLKLGDIPTCPICHHTVKPDVVLFGESLDTNTLTYSAKLVGECDLLIVAGTSLQVFPAAMLVDYYEKSDIICINRDSINLRTTSNVLMFNEKVGEVFKKIDKYIIYEK